jgi:hypothetical protein
MAQYEPGDFIERRYLTAFYRSSGARPIEQAQA